MITSLGQYIYTSDAETIYTHLFIGSESTLAVNGADVTVQQTTNYPWDGKATFSFKMEQSLSFTLALRLPGWCQKAELLVNGETVDYTSLLRDGYVYIHREWSATDTVEWVLQMDVQIVYAHPELRANAGRVALQRGPLVYSVEQADNGDQLASLAVMTEMPLEAYYDSSLLGGCTVIKGQAIREQNRDAEHALYRLQPPARVEQSFIAVPYFLWGNRGEGEMSVWLRKA